MHDIACPHCGNAFTIDKAGYTDIVAQMCTKEFEADFQECLHAAEGGVPQVGEQAQPQVKAEPGRTAIAPNVGKGGDVSRERDRFGTVLRRTRATLGKSPLLLLASGLFLYCWQDFFTGIHVGVGFGGLVLWALATIWILLRIALRLIQRGKELSSTQIVLSLVGVWLPHVIVAGTIAANKNSGIGSPGESVVPVFFDALTGVIDVVDSQSTWANFAAVVFVLLVRLAFVVVTSITFSVIVWSMVRKASR